MNVMKQVVAGALLFASVMASAGDAVKYRGIFINDEDWGIRPWAEKHFGKKEAIGLGAYDVVFTMMTNANLNLIWPAMHEGGYEYSKRPENLEQAKRYGIRVGTSHCEPMLRNNCYLSKADRKKWSWLNNKEFLLDYWKEGVRRGADQDVLWTIGMRGIHDGKLQDGKDSREKIKILEEVFAAQKAMLPEGAEMLFCPYKEVLPLYNAGLKVPDEAIVMWVNDNFGYVRRVGGPSCPNKRAGIYWHIDYYGRPHGYTKVCATPPAFMWYELVAKCWENGVRDVWMVNAGDVFPASILIDAYGRYASDPEAWKTRGADVQKTILTDWATKTFDAKSAPAVVEHLSEFYNIGFNRRPEHMAIQWTTNLPQTVKASLLTRYHNLLKRDAEVEALVPAEKRDEYFRLIGFQAKFLAKAGIIHLEGRGKEEAAEMYKDQYARWDAMAGGKWSGLWCDTIDDVTKNRWSTHMQWPWNEPEDPNGPDPNGRGDKTPRAQYYATAYRADVAEPAWLEPTEEKAAADGAWTVVPGLGVSGRARALLPVKPGAGEGASLTYQLPDGAKTVVLQFLPDFALWPGLKLGVNAAFDGAKAKFVEVPASSANIGERNPVRNRAVQDNFIRVELSVPEGAKSLRIEAVAPGVVLDRLGVR